MDDMIKKYGHYVQGINYPTVPKGEEKLRVAPTPHHTKEMMDQFTKDIAALWQEVGLELKPVKLSSGKSGCPGSDGKSCQFCQQPTIFENMEVRMRNCQEPNCPGLQAAIA